MVTYLSSQMVVACKNHLVLNFKSRFTKYLKLIFDSFSKEHIFFLVSSIIGEDDFDNNEENLHLHTKYNTPQNLKIITDYQKLFNKPKKGEINIWNNLDVFLPFYKTMLDKFIACEKKAFTLLPHKGSFIPGFVAMDTTVLENMIAIKNKKAVRKDMIDNDPLGIWYENTNIKNFETKRRKFDFIIETNGYEVSIHIKTPRKGLKLPYNPNNNILSIDEKIEIHKKIKEKWKQNKDEKRIAEELQKQEDKENGIEIPKKIPYQMDIIDSFESYQNYLGLDPGKRNLFTTYDKNMKHLKCSGKEYHHMIGQKKDLRKINNRKNEEIKKLGEYSFKVNTFEEYLKNLKEVNKLVNAVWSEYEKEFYRGLNFSKYQKKKDAYEKLGNRLEGIEKDNEAINEMRRKQEKGKGIEKIVEKKVIIGYGLGGSNGSGIKGSSMPIKGLYMYLKKRKNLKVVGINECYTSQKCHECQRQLEDHNQWQMTRISEDVYEKKLRSVYGLRCCKSNKCRNAIYDRDENASKNIYKILVAGSLGNGRPQYLRLKKKSNPQGNT